MRILFRNYNFGEGTKQQLLYGVAVLICIVSVFGIVLFLAYFSEDPSKGGFPSPTPGVFSNLSAQAQQQQGQVAGAHTQQQPVQQQQPPPAEGPAMPSLLPSPSPSPSPLPAPPVVPSTAPLPSANNSTPTPTPTPNPTQTSTPTPTPVPSAPTNMSVSSSCNGNQPKNEISWNSVTGATSYKIYRNGEVISPGAPTSPYTDSNVTAGQSYLYFVRAVNPAGESSDSNSQTVSQNSCASPSPSPSPSP